MALLGRRELWQEVDASMRVFVHAKGLPHEFPLEDVHGAQRRLQEIDGLACAHSKLVVPLVMLVAGIRMTVLTLCRCSNIYFYSVEGRSASSLDEKGAARVCLDPVARNPVATIAVLRRQRQQQNLFEHVTGPQPL